MGKPLVGGVVVAINSQKLATTTKISLKANRNIAQKYGPFGFIGSGKGQFKFSGTLSFAVPKEGMEVDLDALAAAEGGFSVTYQKGAARYVVNCEIADDSLTNDPLAGETDNEVGIVGANPVRIN